MRTRLMMRRLFSCLLAVLMLSLSVVTVYLVYIRRGSVQDTLAANRVHPSQGLYDTESSNVIRKALASGVDEEEAQIMAYQYERWDRFLKENNYVSIGSLYDKCAGDDRLLLGKVVMLPDPVLGGVTSLTFLNVTIVEKLADGEMFIRVAYNGRELYFNHWPLCEVEDGFPDRVIFCPIKVGRQRFVKQLKIPNYLPKGRYEVKAWAKNEDGEVVGCCLTDFTL